MSGWVDLGTGADTSELVYLAAGPTSLDGSTWLLEPTGLDR